MGKRPIMNEQKSIDEGLFEQELGVQTRAQSPISEFLKTHPTYMAVKEQDFTFLVPKKYLNLFNKQDDSIRYDALKKGLIGVAVVSVVKPKICDSYCTIESYRTNPHETKTMLEDLASATEHTYR